MHGFYMRRNLWADLDHMRFNGRIVGAFITGIADIPIGRGGHHQYTKGK
jgi:hypothetical protein